MLRLRLAARDDRLRRKNETVAEAIGPGALRLRVGGGINDGVTVGLPSELLDVRCRMRYRVRVGAVEGHHENLCCVVVSGQECEVCAIGRKCRRADVFASGRYRSADAGCEINRDQRRIPAGFVPNGV